MLFFLLISFFAFSQTAGYNSAYAFFNIKGTSKAYKLFNNSDGVTPPFEGANLGLFNSGSVFELQGAEHNVFKCNGCNITATNFNYRIFANATSPGSFLTKSIGYSSGAINGCGGEDQQWKDITGTTNLLAGLTPGNYTIEVYSDAPASCGTVYASNFGANFKATFTYATDFTWNGSTSSTWVNASNWTPNLSPSATDNVIINTPGTNVLNITGSRTVNNFTVNGTGTFNASSTADVSINGDFIFGTTATANLNCSSFLRIKSPTSQNIPALNYGNLDITGGPRVLSATGIIKICSDYVVDTSLYSYSSAGSTVEYTAASGNHDVLPFTYNNLSFSGAGNFFIGSTLPAGDKIINVNGNYLHSAGTVVLGNTVANTATLNIDGDLTFSAGTFDINKTSGGKGTLNLKGDLAISNTAQIFATSNTITNTNLNFTGAGDGLSAVTTQTIDVANQITASNIAFNVNSGAYVRIVNQNLALGTNSAFNVKSGGTLDFGFGAATALNIIRAGAQNGQRFSSDAGSTLKISSPDGITKTAGLGNVQVPAGNRIFSEDATFYFIGKSNPDQVTLNGVDQVSGNAFPTATSTATAQKVIIDLGTTNIDQDDVSVKSLGITRLNDGGYVKIIKGKVEDESENAFEDAPNQDAALIMTGGRYTFSRSGTQPGLGGVYTLTGGVIEFAGSSAVDIRTSRNFLNVEVSGTNVSPGSATAGVTLLAGGKFTVKDNGVFKVANVNGFSGLTTTGVRSANSPAIYLEPLSTIEYNGAGDQTVSKVYPTSLADAHYQNLKISGTGVKTATGITIVKNTTNVDGAELVVASTADNTLPNEFYATNGVMVNNSNGAKFRLGNNANLFQAATATNVGHIIVERNLNLSTGRQQYNYIISPLIGTNLTTIYKDSAGNPVAVPFVLYHNEANDKFYNSTGVYIPGRALAVKEPTAVDFSPSTMVASFFGVPQNGTVNFNLLNSYPADPQRGNNLIGNPYPSNLDLVAFYTMNSTNLDPTFRFWDNKANTETVQQGNNYSGNAYATFNAALGTGLKATGDVGTNSIKAPTGFVKIGQGFMARALVNNLSVNFDNSLRKAGISEGFFGKRVQDSATVDRFWVSMISPDNIASPMAVVYLEGVSNELTKEDSRSMEASDEIYSLVEGQKVSINGKSSFKVTDEVDLGTTHFSSGIYKIMIDNTNGIFANGQNVYLKDREIGILTNLTESSYIFQANAGESTGRFEILYQPETVLATDGNFKEMVTVYMDGNDFVVNAQNRKITHLEVYDAAGRLMVQVKPNALKVKIPAEQMINGVYILKIDQNGELTTKKMIR